MNLMRIMPTQGDQNESFSRFVFSQAEWLFHLTMK